MRRPRRSSSPVTARKGTATLPACIIRHRPELGSTPRAQLQGASTRSWTPSSLGAPSGWSLQLIVDGAALHTAALMRHWRSGRPPRFRVFGTASAAVWDDLMDRLAGVMEERWWSCGVHQRGDHLLNALYGRAAPQTLTWPGIWQQGQTGPACACEAHRARLMMPWYASYYGKRQTINRRCKCNELLQCRSCCERRYRVVLDQVTGLWHEAFGAGPVIQLTLTYRPGFSLRPDEWLGRARRDVRVFRRGWARDWGCMPPHLMCLEWTSLGVPHFHVLVPWEAAPYLETLREWAWKTWVEIVGGILDRRTRYRHAVHAEKYPIAAARIEYLLKTVRYPRWQVAPLGIPPFHRWYGSYQQQPWHAATRPSALLQPV